jgi:hypothetical protein
VHFDGYFLSCLQSLFRGPVARPWTQWVQQLPLQMMERTYVYTPVYCFIIHLIACKCYVCIGVKTRLWPDRKNQHFNYAMRSLTLHKTLCAYIRFWKCVVSNHGWSTETISGWGNVLWVFLVGWTTCLSSKFCTIPNRCIQILYGVYYTYLHTSGYRSVLSPGWK